MWPLEEEYSVRRGCSFRLLLESVQFNRGVDTLLVLNIYLLNKTKNELIKRQAAEG